MVAWHAGHRARRAVGQDGPQEGRQVGAERAALRRCELAQQLGRGGHGGRHRERGRRRGGCAARPPRLMLPRCSPPGKQLGGVRRHGQCECEHKQQHSCSGGDGMGLALMFYVAVQKCTQGCFAWRRHRVLLGLCASVKHSERSNTAYLPHASHLRDTTDLLRLGRLDTEHLRELAALVHRHQDVRAAQELLVHVHLRQYTNIHGEIHPSPQLTAGASPPGDAGGRAAGGGGGRTWVRVGNIATSQP